MLDATSDILYVRAALKPLARPIRAEGGILKFLHSRVSFSELIVPHFSGARPFWRGLPEHSPPPTNSGALGKIIAKEFGAVISSHPSHAFAGFGPRVSRLLAKHDSGQPCFSPIGSLADQYDFSMLLLGCCDESPGFSTVHVAQHRLGLSQRHLLRLLFRWDTYQNGDKTSFMAPEAPGCSASFNKFYPYYEADRNLQMGVWHGVKWLYISSAKRALAVETALLKQCGRFVDCGRWNCLSCRLRLY